MRTTKPKAILLLVVVVLVAASIGVYRYVQGQYGYANISFQLADTKNLVANVNGKPLALTGLDGTYKLPIGIQKLVVSKLGYASFSTSFRLERGQTVLISVALRNTSAPKTTEAANTQVKASLNNSLPAGFALLQSTYFYDNTWVVARVQASNTDPAVVVASYDVTSNSWNIVLGPGTLFDESSSSDLPAEVSTYLHQQHMVSGGA